MYVDYKTQKRTPKASAHWYSNVIAANGLVKQSKGRVGEEFVGEMEKRGQLEWVKSCRDEEMKVVSHGHGLASHRMLVLLVLVLSFLCYAMYM